MSTSGRSRVAIARRSDLMLIGLVRRFGASHVDEICAVAIAADMFDVFRLERTLEVETLPTPEPEPARVIPSGATSAPPLTSLCRAPRGASTKEKTRDRFHQP